jgi:hypothetical protein
MLLPRGGINMIPAAARRKGREHAPFRTKRGRDAAPKFRWRIGCATRLYLGVILSPLQGWNEARSLGPRVCTLGYFLPPP